MQSQTAPNKGSHTRRNAGASVDVKIKKSGRAAVLKPPNHLGQSEFLLMVDNETFLEEGFLEEEPSALGVGGEEQGLGCGWGG